MIESVLEAYGIKGAQASNFGNGLIHQTWKISTSKQNFILQRVHEGVFKKPEDIAYNIRLIADYIQQHYPDYFFVTPVACNSGDEMVRAKEGCFRMFPFVEKSHSIDTVETPAQAYEAAVQFGKFTKLLSQFDTTKLRITIPDFHNLELRYQQFQQALRDGNADRIRQSQPIIEQLMDFDEIVAEYRSIKIDPDFKSRVTHHDTKISNVLFDESGKAICVIDLDTVMPGYFISDVGDMMRTYLSPVSEEEKDFDKISIRADFYRAIVEGYSSEMKEELTEKESRHFFYAGQFMIYMQALRFLTDFLNNDKYYGTRYEGQNFNRAKNQLVLLQRLTERENELAHL